MTTIEYYHNLDKYKSNSLSHYGTRGQKWGVRHWQNPDGTFNEEGKIRYFGSKSKNSGKDINPEKANRKRTYYLNRAEEDIRKAKSNLLVGTIEAALYGGAALVTGGAVLSMLPITVGTGVVVASHLVRAGMDGVDAIHCERKAKKYYKLLEDMSKKKEVETDE